MGRTYLFYDLETTGRNHVFDQIVQFAAVRTTPDLREVARYEWRVRLRPDVLPAPGALLTHRLSLDELQDGEDEYPVLCRIHALVNEPQTISLGYNSLGFDDLFLRWGFYRNLLEPYTHQYKRGCGRMDLLPLTLLYWLYQEDTLVWPSRDGEPSLKLELLNQANNLASGMAHDALVDVLATLELARRLRDRRRMWDYCHGYFQTGIDGERREQLEAEQIGDHAYPLGLLIDRRYGYARRCQSPVLGLGAAARDPKRHLWLRLDDPELPGLTWATADDAWVTRKKDGEPPLLLPLEKAQLDDGRTLLVKRNLAWVRDNPAQLALIARHFQDRAFDDAVQLDADAGLYQNGFVSGAERKICDAFHRGTPAERLAATGRFQAPYLRELARRLLARNPSLNAAPLVPPPALDPRTPLVDYRGDPRRTPDQVRAELNTAGADPSAGAADRALLEGYAAYLASRFGAGAS